MLRRADPERICRHDRSLSESESESQRSKAMRATNGISSVSRTLYSNVELAGSRMGGTTCGSSFDVSR